jgi:hypothetical protein
MMSDEFGTSYSCTSAFILPIILAKWELTLSVITALKIERGLALQDLIAGAYDFLLTVDLPAQSRIYLLDHLGSCE